MEALRADLAVATATKLVTESKKKATERLHPDLSVRYVAKGQDIAINLFSMIYS